MGVGVDTRGDAQYDLGRRSDTSCSEHVEPVEFVEGVDDDVADLGFDRLTQFLAGLVVAVERARARRHTGGHRHVEFPAGGDIEQQPLVVGELRHRSAQERLGGVDHAFGPESGNRLATASAQMRFVVHEQRGAVLLGQRLDGDPTDLEPAVVADRRRVRQQPPRDRRHICSGASMPSRSRA